MKRYQKHLFADARDNGETSVDSILCLNADHGAWFTLGNCISEKLISEFLRHRQ